MMSMSPGSNWWGPTVLQLIVTDSSEASTVRRSLTLNRSHVHRASGPASLAIRGEVRAGSPSRAERAS